MDIYKFEGGRVLEASKSLSRALELLVHWRDRPTVTLDELVAVTGWPKTTVHRLVTSLVSAGLLAPGTEGYGYRLGLTWLEYGQLVADRLDIRAISLPLMKQLCDEVDEAVNLVVADGDEAIYIEKVDCNHPVRVYTRVGRRAPLYAGACPRILLAYKSDEEIESYLQRVDLKAYASRTLTDRDKLISVLRESRRKGYTVSYAELEEGTAAIGLPIFDHRGQCVAGLSLAGPDTRFQEKDIPVLLAAARRTAEEISKSLGYKR
ncbi:IclR family transcriptional regulator [Collibacillus ludicampi]|nr:IclR family transcriptional regulator [Collibacillus ludicampi]